MIARLRGRARKKGAAIRDDLAASGLAARLIEWDILIMLPFERGWARRRRAMSRFAPQDRTAELAPLQPAVSVFRRRRAVAMIIFDESAAVLILLGPVKMLVIADGGTGSALPIAGGRGGRGFEGANIFGFMRRSGAYRIPWDIRICGDDDSATRIFSARIRNVLEAFFGKLTNDGLAYGRVSDCDDVPTARLAAILVFRDVDVLLTL